MYPVQVLCHFIFYAPKDISLKHTMWGTFFSRFKLTDVNQSLDSNQSIQNKSEASKASKTGEIAKLPDDNIPAEAKKLRHSWGGPW